VPPPPAARGSLAGIEIPRPPSEPMSSTIVVAELTPLPPPPMPDGVEDMAATRPRMDPSTPFPIAPREWRPSMSQVRVGPDPNEQRNKRIIMGCSITFAVVVLIAITLAGSKPKAAPAPVEEPPPGPGVRVEMKTEQPPTPVEKAQDPPPAEEQPPAEETQAPSPPESATATKADRPKQHRPKVVKPASGSTSVPPAPPSRADRPPAPPPTKTEEKPPTPPKKYNPKDSPFQPTN
jgi:hypothetical protein